jgi:uncharacterized membrane protein YsdA (DUF1294 family)
MSKSNIFITLGLFLLFLLLNFLVYLLDKDREIRKKQNK